MAGNEHHYAVEIEWTGNTGSGTSAFGAYTHDYDIRAAGKPVILGSSDPAFNGDGSRWNPEDLMVVSLSTCHKLWYLALCAGAGVVVTAYVDRAEGWMTGSIENGGHFTRVLLRPEVTLAPGSDAAMAKRLHEKAHARCFIANSVNFPVEHEATITFADAAAA
jgi:organic hydroperoxide reductase OsmC/OhrA